MNSGATVWPLFNSLQAFWPGLQVWITRISEIKKNDAHILDDFLFCLDLRC
jgi:hypothetical protein